jgi:hypothetical protein
VPGTFYELPILNSPYSEPVYHHPPDDYGQPLERSAIPGRRFGLVLRHRRRSAGLCSAVRLGALAASRRAMTCDLAG